MITPFSPSAENQVSDYIYTTAIPGLLYVAPKSFADNRGFYAELVRTPELDPYTDGVPFLIKQVNHSHSQQNVIRGIHAENWNKLLTVINGTAFCAWVDFRRQSPTFGTVVTASVGFGEQAITGSFFVSAGIGNSFCVTAGPLDYMYAVDALYADRDVSGDRAISVFDPELAIPWPLERTALIISERDAAGKSFSSL